MINFKYDPILGLTFWTISVPEIETELEEEVEYPEYYLSIEQMDLDV